MESEQDYTPSLSLGSTNVLYANHYKFHIERLPDLSKFVQAVSAPTVTGSAVGQPNPFVSIQHPGEILAYGTFQATYQIDAHFKTYFSLYYWLKGYGFPHSFDEVVNFRAQQQRLMGNARLPAVAVEKTNATISVVTPDTGGVVAEILIQDVFPTDLSGLQFTSTDTDAAVLTATVTLACTAFDLRLL